MNKEKKQMVAIKQLPEDFAVEEIQPKAAAHGLGGKFAYFWLAKRNLTTLEAVAELSSHFRVSQNSIGFAGTKDKKAVTTQLVSVRWRARETPGDKISVGNHITLQYLCQREEPLRIGQLLGNKFRIAVRDLSVAEAVALEKKCSLLRETKTVPNYFDEQRFSKRNAAIGRALAANNLKGAVAAIIGCEEHELADGLCKAAARGRHDFEAAVLQALMDNPSDFNAAIRIIPFRIKKLFMHAYQAYLFNKTAANYLNATLGKKQLLAAKYSLGTLVFPRVALANRKIPIVGFATNVNEIRDKKLAAIVGAAMKDENISPRSFIIKQLPYLSSEGGSRPLLMKIKNLNCKTSLDELNKGKKKCTLDFELGKGSYATMLVKSLLNQPM
ncbi:MAG TPA: tRNA pseudouridine(13) synthase TruD [Candidatus Nanoarchaeia archaeon]|nr:tRNA pseudouridine(13) synthase TruD [Candidatus Nanoarchaeia archaeon]